MAITLDDVINLARTAHADQTDRLGRGYVESHLRPVADKLADHGEAAVMAGWLHGIVEHEKSTVEDLRAKGVPEDVVSAVESVTHRDGEADDDMIERAAADPLGRLIALADSEVNLEANAELARRDPNTAWRLRQQYAWAWARLLAKGHLFVVHGRIEAVTHDVAIIPTDEYVEIEESRWADVIKPETEAAGEAPRLLPDGWSRWGTSRLWLLDVALGDMSDVLARLAKTLQDIAEQRPWRDNVETKGRPLGRRPLPLVALPVLGIGQGGRSEERGQVLADLLGALTTQLRDLPFDIALVTPDPAVYAAAQHQRRRTLQVPAEYGPLVEQATTLAKSAEEGAIALFLGAGVSIPAGLPTWSELVDELSKDLQADDQAALQSLDITDRAQLIEKLQPDDFHKRVADITEKAPRPSLVHTLLAGLDVANIVTTNYDTLMEAAMKAAGHTTDVVMPHQSAIGQRRWVLKMHGDVEHPDKIVLTRRHMVMYDAANRPSAALLQSLLLTKHLVVIGASMTDPNVVRLTHEVDEYRSAHQEAPHEAYGTVLDVGPPSPSQARLWEHQLEWVSLGHNEIGSGPRALEILLDLVGMHASRDASWLLDPRFAGLLDTGQRDFAEKVQELAWDRALRDPTWGPLRQALITLGAKDVVPQADPQGQ